MTESAFSVWRVSTNSAIWSCISGGISSKPIATILWVVTDCGLVQDSTPLLEWIKRIQYTRQPRSKSTEQAIVRRVDPEATVPSRFVTNPCLGSRLWNGRCEPYHIAALSQNRMYLSFLLSKLCENRKDRGVISPVTAREAEGTSYAHIRAHIHSYFTIPFSPSHYSFSCRPSVHHSRPSHQRACSHLSPGHPFSPPSLLHSTLQRMVPYSHSHSLPLAKSQFPHDLHPAASPRSVSHSRKSQSHCCKPSGFGTAAMVCTLSVYV